MSVLICIMISMMNVHSTIVQIDDLILTPHDIAIVTYWAPQKNKDHAGNQLN